MRMAKYLYIRCVINENILAVYTKNTLNHRRLTAWSGLLFSDCFPFIHFLSHLQERCHPKTFAVSFFMPKYNKAYIEHSGKPKYNKAYIEYSGKQKDNKAYIEHSDKQKYNKAYIEHSGKPKYN